MAVMGSGGEGNGELLFSGYRFSVSYDKKVLELACITRDILNIIHPKTAKTVNFTLCMFWHKFKLKNIFKIFIQNFTMKY